MLKVVFDANIIISALCYPESLPAKVFKLARKRQVLNCISDDILAEIQRNLVKKFAWQEQDAYRAQRWLLSFSELITPGKQIKALEYLPDNRILECAVAGGVQAIVTGNMLEYLVSSMPDFGSYHRQALLSNDIIFLCKPSKEI
ncbi:MAG: putative toxin-antitoxin system toxin component, PIN family [Nitrospirae bacterium YQR-1]